MFSLLGGIRLTDLVDIAVVAFLIFVGITWFRKTQARLALIGLTILGAVYLAARILGLEVTAWILQGFFAAFVIVVIVVFQYEIRRFFEQIALWGTRRRRRAPAPDSVEVLVRSVQRLAERRSGALLVFPGSEPIDRHLDGGIRLDALVSEPLLLSIFDTHSPGHDGAVLIDGDRIRVFAVRLPLSANQAELGARGTRHAAALGLSERTDSLTVVVSEERGTVTTAAGGRLRTLARPEDLDGSLRAFLLETAKLTGSPRPAWKRLGARWLEIASSVLIASLLWFVLATGSTTIEVTRSAVVVPDEIPADFIIERVEPPEVDVTLSGRRRYLFPSAAEPLEVHLDVSAVKDGRRTFPITGDLVDGPENVKVVDIDPGRVRVICRRAP